MNSLHPAGLSRWALPLAVALVALLLAQSLPALWQTWWTVGTYNHCLTIFPLASWLLWRAEVAAPTPAALLGWPGAARGSRGLWVALAALVALAGVWAVARLLSVQVLEQAALVALPPLLVWAVNGPAYARRHRFALAFCLLAVPFGDFLIPPLMQLTAAVAVTLVRLSGVPVLRDGMQFSTAAGNFVVAEACSGIRYLIASVTLGLLFAQLNFRSPRRKAWFLLASVLLPLAANGVRGWMMVMIGYYSDMQYAVGFDHLVYGWLLFGLVMSLLFWVGSRYREVVDLGAGRFTGVVRPAGSGGTLGFRGLVVMALISVGWAPLAVQGVARQLAAISPHLDKYQWPETIGAFEYQRLASFPTQPRYPGADRFDAAVYHRGALEVHVAVARYVRDRPGHEVVSQLNFVYGDEWARVGLGEAALKQGADTWTAATADVTPQPRAALLTLITELPDAGSGPGGAAEAGAAAPVWRVTHWYAIAGEQTRSDLRAKLLAAVDWTRPRTAHPPPAVYLVAVPRGLDAADAAAVATLAGGLAARP